MVMSQKVSKDLPPRRLGDILGPKDAKQSKFQFGSGLKMAAIELVKHVILTAVLLLAVWWFLSPDGNSLFIFIALSALLILIWWQLHRSQNGQKWRRGNAPERVHSLLANDRQGFMADLLLDAKTAAIDGSNIYHFGRSVGLDAQPLGMIAEQLRSEGFRVICFFDANIFYTLQQDRALSVDQVHSLQLLDDIFGLERDEIYVVPSGVQADRYILNTLKYLPISFAVTNDQFRDYAKQYPTVIKGQGWRKGVALSKNEIKLLQHRFKTPLLIT
jgi:hypothetical protein